MERNRKKYDREFKQKAVELSYARGNASEIAEELGIDKGLLYRWRKVLGTKEPSLQFNYIPLDMSNTDVYKLYMKQLLHSFSDLSKVDDKEVFFTAIDIPMFHFLPYTELTLFKVFSWYNSTGAFKGNFSEFCNIMVDDELTGIYKQLTEAYKVIPSVEIWTDRTFDTILRLIDYIYSNITATLSVIGLKTG